MKRNEIFDEMARDQLCAIVRLPVDVAGRESAARSWLFELGGLLAPW